MGSYAVRAKASRTSEASSTAGTVNLLWTLIIGKPAAATAYCFELSCFRQLRRTLQGCNGVAYMEISIQTVLIYTLMVPRRSTFHHIIINVRLPGCHTPCFLGTGHSRVPRGYPRHYLCPGPWLLRHSSRAKPEWDASLSWGSWWPVFHYNWDE